MLAALLLNLGGPAPTQPRFGGGPFWRRYGYDKAYSDIQATTSPAPSADVVDIEHIEVVKIPVSRTHKRDYRLVNQRVSESVAREMRSFWKEELERRAQEDEEEEAIALMMFL